MKEIITGFCMLFCFSDVGFAQKLPPLKPQLAMLNPENIFPLHPGKDYFFTDKTKAEKPASFNADIRESSLPLFTAEVITASKSHYDIQSIWKSTARVKKGDVLLARFAIRSIYARQESGEAVVYFFIQQAMPPYEKSVIADISAGPEWKTIEIPFVASYDMNAGEAAICISYAVLAQKVEIAGIEVLNFQNKAVLAQMPATRFTYLGREKDAAWRTAALKRIEDIRTAALNIQVTDANGKPIVGASVQAKLIQSDFIWGTSVNEALLANELPDSENYRRILKELFNTAVIENGFKGATWNSSSMKQVEAIRAFGWLEQHEFRQRAHNLVWPGWKFNSKLAKETAERDSAAFKKMIEDAIRAKIAVLKGRVIAWDVINELIHERDFLKFLPRDAPEQWFKLAKMLDPGAQLFINEYGMLNSIASPQNIKNYLDTITRLRSNGAPIDAIGIQGHVGRQPRNPAQVMSDLDLITSTGLPVQITEFDINMTDEELQADYTKDFLIACYSHPVVTGFTIWGFWQGAHWKKDAAMFRTDWTAKPNAEVWRDLVTRQWKTNISEISNKEGKVNSRGHLGRYKITVTKENKVVSSFYQLTKDAVALKILL